MSKKITYIGNFLIITAMIFITQFASAQSLDKQYKDWSVYTANKDGNKLCYMVSSPKKQGGNYRYRSEPYVMVTNVNGDKIEFSVTSGYEYKSNTEPSAIIDDKEYKLSMTSGEMAWFKSDKYDDKVITKMKKSITLKVKGISAKGTSSIDTYSLKGFTDAYNSMINLCKS